MVGEYEFYGASEVLTVCVNCVDVVMHACMMCGLLVLTNEHMKR